MFGKYFAAVYCVQMTNLDITYLADLTPMRIFIILYLKYYEVMKVITKVENLHKNAKNFDDNFKIICCIVPIVVITVIAVVVFSRVAFSINRWGCFLTYGIRIVMITSVWCTDIFSRTEYKIVGCLTHKSQCQSFCKHILTWDTYLNCK